MLQGPNSPSSHSSILPIHEWYIRYIFQVIEKMQTENIKAFEPKKAAVRDFYNHTHELMKRLAWSSGTCSLPSCSPPPVTYSAPSWGWEATALPIFFLFLIFTHRL